MSEIVVDHPASSATTPQPARASEKAWDHYMESLESLYQHAWTNEEPKTLADTLTWTLARIVMAYGGTLVAGDIVRRLGDHIHFLAERQNAIEQAAKEKEEGRTSH